MKTKDNIQKTVTKSVVVFVCLVLFGTTVNAQHSGISFIEYDTLSPIALAIRDNTALGFMPVLGKNTIKRTSITELLKDEPEEKMELENWMFKVNNFSYTFILNEESENALKLENWMLNDGMFNEKTLQIEAASDNSLVLEAWMTNEQLWKVR